MKFGIWSVVVALLGCGCATDNLDHNVSAPAAHRAYFVMGVTPADARVLIFDGLIQNGIFEKAPPPAAFSAEPQSGYLVGQVAADKPYGVMMIKFGDNHWGWPCRDSKVAVFSLPAGKVVYLGDVEFQRQDQVGLYALHVQPCGRDRVSQGAFPATLQPA